MKIYVTLLCTLVASHAAPVSERDYDPFSDEDVGDEVPDYPSKFSNFLFNVQRGMADQGTPQENGGFRSEPSLNDQSKFMADGGWREVKEPFINDYGDDESYDPFNDRERSSDPNNGQNILTNIDKVEEDGENYDPFSDDESNQKAGQEEFRITLNKMSSDDRRYNPFADQRGRNEDESYDPFDEEREQSDEKMYDSSDSHRGQNDDEPYDPFDDEHGRNDDGAAKVNMKTEFEGDNENYDPSDDGRSTEKDEAKAVRQKEDENYDPFDDSPQEKQFEPVQKTQDQIMKSYASFIERNKEDDNPFARNERNDETDRYDPFADDEERKSIQNMDHDASIWKYMSKDGNKDNLREVDRDPFANEDDENYDPFADSENSEQKEKLKNGRHNKEEDEENYDPFDDSVNTGDQENSKMDQTKAEDNYDPFDDSAEEENGKKNDEYIKKEGDGYDPFDDQNRRQPSDFQLPRHQEEHNAEDPFDEENRQQPPDFHLLYNEGRNAEDPFEEYKRNNMQEYKSIDNNDDENPYNPFNSEDSKSDDKKAFLGVFLGENAEQNEDLFSREEGNRNEEGLNDNLFANFKSDSQTPQEADAYDPFS